MKDNYYEPVEYDKCFIPQTKQGSYPEVVNAMCKICEKITEYKYQGFQEGFEDEKGFPLYNCIICGDTRSVEGLERKVGE